MSPQSQYVIGLYRDVNPTKNRCRHNIGCPLGFSVWIEAIINIPSSSSSTVEAVLDFNAAWVLKFNDASESWFDHVI